MNQVPDREFRRVRNTMVPEGVLIAIEYSDDSCTEYKVVRDGSVQTRIGEEWSPIETANVAGQEAFFIHRAATLLR